MWTMGLRREEGVLTAQSCWSLIYITVTDDYQKWNWSGAETEQKERWAVITLGSQSTFSPPKKGSTEFLPPMIGQRWVPDVEKMSKDLTEALKQHLGDTGWENGGKNPIPNSQVVNSIRRTAVASRL